MTGDVVFAGYGLPDDFKKLDVNVDGEITRSEASDEALRLPGVIETFADYDVSGDGRIVMAEFLREDVIAWWMTELRPRIQALFLKTDTNGDLKLTESSAILKYLAV